MNGTDKQIKWASDLKSKMDFLVEQYVINACNSKGITDTDKYVSANKADKRYIAVMAIDDASWWINNCQYVTNAVQFMSIITNYKN